MAGLVRIPEVCIRRKFAKFIFGAHAYRRGFKIVSPDAGMGARDCNLARRRELQSGGVASAKKTPVDRCPP